MDWITTVPAGIIPDLLERPRGDFRPVPFLATYYYIFNTTRPPLDDARVRRALGLAIDKGEIVRKVTRAGQMPAGSLVPAEVAKYVPYELREGDWTSQKEVFADAVIDTLAEYAPGIRDAVLHRSVLAPTDLENIYGLPEGNPNHGEMTLDQFFHMRPVPGSARYRAPIAGFYPCGAGTHPGGGVTGIPGQNAAREILKDSQ